MKEVQTYSTAEDRLYTDVRTIIEEARMNAIRSVDFSRVVMYWKTGRRVFEEEQNGGESVVNCPPHFRSDLTPIVLSFHVTLRRNVHFFLNTQNRKIVRKKWEIVS